MGEWQLLADMSFADLLWVPLDELRTPPRTRRRPPGRRPRSSLRRAGPLDDRADGAFRTTSSAGGPPPSRSGSCAAPSLEGRICRATYDPRWHLRSQAPRDHGPVPPHRRRPVPDTNLPTPRVPGPRWRSPTWAARVRPVPDDRRSASFPPQSGPPGAPRVLRAPATVLCAAGRNGNVAYASPNALSAYHRMGYRQRRSPTCCGHRRWCPTCLTARRSPHPDQLTCASAASPPAGWRSAGRWRRCWCGAAAEPARRCRRRAGCWSATSLTCAAGTRRS
ncbi:hypothetical protein HBB16_07240 [Pseudonocardia sp. MCCB 268]|nr:hypothetical protein [Pseudonocardia cytotoxica]